MIIYFWFILNHFILLKLFLLSFIGPKKNAFLIKHINYYHPGEIDGDEEEKEQRKHKMWYLKSVTHNGENKKVEI